MNKPPLLSSPLLDDFMLLLCASLQRQVFDDENKASVRIMAGDNVEICRDLDAASFSVHNPVPDFLHCRYSIVHRLYTRVYSAARSVSVSLDHIYTAYGTELDPKVVDFKFDLHETIVIILLPLELDWANSNTKDNNTQQQRGSEIDLIDA